MVLFPKEFLLFLCSYLICRLSKNKVVNFVFGSIMGTIVLANMFPLPSDDSDLLVQAFAVLGVFGLSFLTGYAIAKATT